MNLVPILDFYGFFLITVREQGVLHGRSGLARLLFDAAHRALYFGASDGAKGYAGPPVGGSFVLGLFNFCLYADARSRKYFTTNLPWRDGSGAPHGRHVT